MADLAGTSTPNLAAPREWASMPRSSDEIALDIIIPAYNEEHRIEPTLHAYRRGFPGPEVRFIIALDDCEDATPEIVRRHAEEDPRVELHDFPKLGKGGVILGAFDRCQADLIAFVDADGSTAPEELALLVHTARHFDGAIASRRLPESTIHGRRGLPRAAASSAFAWLVRRLFRLPYRDTVCGAKVISRELLNGLRHRVTTNDLVFDVDLLIQAHRLGSHVVEVPTVWVARPGSRVSLIRDVAPVTRSLFRLWRAHRKWTAEPTSSLTPQIRWDGRAA